MHESLNIVVCLSFWFLCSSQALGLLYAFGGSAWRGGAGPSSGLGLSHRSVCRVIYYVAAGDFESGVRLGDGHGGDGVNIPGEGGLLVPVDAAELHLTHRIKVLISEEVIM
jgi:hypothetical protein